MSLTSIECKADLLRHHIILIFIISPVYVNVYTAATSVTCDRQFLCPGETTITCICATGNSNALAWTINGSRLEFMSNNASLTRHDIPGSSGFAVLTENSIVNGIRVIMSNITLSVFSSDIILTCQNVDQSMTEPIIVPIIGKCYNYDM